MAQHVAPPALDESGAIAGNDKFDPFTKHEDALLGGCFDDGISSINNRYQDRARRDTEDVSRVLLPVWGHPKKSCCEWGISSDLLVQVIVVISASVSVGCGYLA